jgi:hypothetical protein
LRLHFRPGGWLVEAGPAGAGIELVRLVEQFRPTADTAKSALLLGKILVAESRFGAMAAGYFVDLGREQLAPFGLGPRNFFSHRAFFLSHKTAAIIRMCYLKRHI